MCAFQTHGMSSLYIATIRYESFYYCCGNSNLLFQGIHKFKAIISQSRGGGRRQSYDPIPPVATAIASEAHLLCFDEFQVRVCVIWLCYHC